MGRFRNLLVLMMFSHCGTFAAGKGDNNSNETPLSQDNLGILYELNSTTVPTGDKSTTQMPILRLNATSAPTSVKKSAEKTTTEAAETVAAKVEASESKVTVPVPAAATTKPISLQPEESEDSEDNSSSTNETGETAAKVQEPEKKVSDDDKGGKPVGSKTPEDISYAEDQPTNSHFVTYLIVIGCLCAVAYLICHRKNQILGLIVEGRRGGGDRRRDGYRRLPVETPVDVVPKDTNVIY